MNGKGSSPRNLGPAFRENYSSINWKPMKQKSADTNKWQRANVSKRAKLVKQDRPQDIFDDIEAGYQHFLQKRMRVTKKDMV
jgi:hypothetical protein